MVTARNDLVIRDDVTDSLRSDVRIDANDVDVEVKNGVVHLHGTVASLFQKRMATEIAGRIKGVVDVVNELKVVPVTWRTDTAIADDIRAVMTRDPLVDETQVSVAVTNGIALLTGIVDSVLERNFAERDARSVPGVTDIVNDLTIRSSPPARTDAEIAAEVAGALARDARIDAFRVKVDAHGGVVHLRGSVPTFEAKRLAEEEAWLTAGVRSVINELTVLP